MSASDVAMFGWPIYSDEGVLLSPTLDGGDWVASGSIALANVQDPRMERVARSTSLDLQDTRLRCDLKTDRMVRVIALPKTTLSQGAYVRFLGVPGGILSTCLEAGDDVASLGGTFTRATTATYFDRKGTMRSVGPGEIRDGHFVSGKRTVLLEGARTNRCLRSEDFSHAAWGVTNVTVTANAHAAPDGTVTADKVAATASAAAVILQQIVAAGATAWTYSIFVRRGSGDTDANTFGLYNVTTSSTLFSVTVNYATGVTTVTGGAGSARVTAPGELADGWYRLELSVTAGITAGDTLNVYAGFAGGPETAGEFCYVWGAQLEAGGFASTYIPTNAATATRNADFLSFAFGAAPAALTAYIRYRRPIDFVATSAASLLMVTSSPPTNPLFFMRHEALAAVRMYHNNAIASVEESAGAPAAGDLVEAVMQIDATGAVTAIVSVNGAAPTTVGPSAANAFAASWGAPTEIFIGSQPGSSTEPFAAFESIRVASGVLSLDQMRALVYDSGWFQPWPAGGYTLEDVQGVNIPAFQVLPESTLLQSVSVQIDDAANTDGYLDLARLVVAGGFQPELNFDQGSSEGFAHSSTEAETDGGSLIVDARPLRRTLSATFSNLEEVEVYATLRKLMRVAGIKGQFFLVLNPSADPSVLWEQAYLAKLRAISPIKFAFMTRQTVPIEAEEVL